MVILVTSDLHLTDKTADVYRWEIFTFLSRQVESLKEKYKEVELFVLGDITDFKDRHSANLVNSIIISFQTLIEKDGIKNIYFLRGNHDCIDETWPFFKFLDTYPNMHWINTAQMYLYESKDFNRTHKCLFIPHYRMKERYASIFKAVRDKDDRPDIVFMHETFNGALASNGQKMEGLNIRSASKLQVPIISGDIHVPQRIKNLTYVGSPYHVRFGDKFEPRVMLITEENDKLKLNSIPTNMPKKHVFEVSSLKDIEPLWSKFEEISLVMDLMVRIDIVTTSDNIGDIHHIKSEIDNLRKKFEGSSDLFEIRGKNLLKERILKKEANEPSLERKQPEELIENIGKKHNMPEEMIELGKAFYNDAV